MITLFKKEIYTFSQSHLGNIFDGTEPPDSCTGSQALKKHLEHSHRLLPQPSSVDVMFVMHLMHATANVRPFQKLISFLPPDQDILRKLIHE